MTLQTTGSSKQRQIWFNDVTVLVKPLKTILLQNDGGVWGDDPDSDEDTIVLRSTEQTVSGEWNIENPARRKLSLTEVKKAVLKSGDLLLTKSSGSASHIGKTSLVNEYVENLSACYSNFMQRLRLVEGVNPKYVYYFLNNELARQQFAYLSNTTTGLSNLNAEIIGAIQIPVPDDKTQNLIVAYLEKQTAKIDSLVKEKQNFIDLLKEKRQALISHFVTKGLDANVHLKDSGDDWLGPIPNHWTLSKLKYVSKIFGRIGFKGYTTDDIVEPGGGAITLSPGNMKSGTMDYSKLSYLSWEKYEESPEIKIYDGDILMVKTGSTYGKVSYVEGLREPATINPQIIVFKNITIIPKFLFYWLSSTYLTAISKTNNSGGTMPTMSQNNIENFKIALPNIQEQTAIVEQIDLLNNRLRKIISEVETSISLLKEQRTALISAAVTGKIDVRNHDKMEAI